MSITAEQIEAAVDYAFGAAVKRYGLHVAATLQEAQLARHRAGVRIEVLNLLAMDIPAKDVAAECDISLSHVYRIARDAGSPVRQGWSK